jgi:hypothetical protein
MPRTTRIPAAQGPLSRGEQGNEENATARQIIASAMIDAEYDVSRPIDTITAAAVRMAPNNAEACPTPKPKQ